MHASLRRLATDRIDVYQFHVNGADADRAADLVPVLEELVDQGPYHYGRLEHRYPARAEVLAMRA